MLSGALHGTGAITRPTGIPGVLSTGTIITDIIITGIRHTTVITGDGTVIAIPAGMTSTITAIGHIRGTYP